MKILIITDAWQPQTNGVVRVYENLNPLLIQKGHTVEMIHPGLFTTISIPRYREIRIAFVNVSMLRRR